VRAYIIFFILISPLVFGDNQPDANYITSQDAQSANISGAFKGTCVKGTNTTPTDLATEALGAHLANSSNVNFSSLAQKDMATLQSLYEGAGNKQSGGTESQKKLLLRMKSLFEQEIEEKVGSHAILNLAQTKDVADAVVKLESMQTCRAAVTKEHNEMISLYNDQIQLYSTAEAYLAEEQIKKENGYVLTNKAFAVIENQKSTWEEVEKAVKETTPVITKLGQTTITDLPTTKEIPQIVKVKWACASGLRMSMGLLDRPFTEGGTSSIDQALTRYETHSRMVDSLLVGCKTMITHNLTGAPKDVSTFCAEFIKNEEDVIAACPSTEMAEVSLDPNDNINQRHAKISAAIAHGQNKVDDTNQTMPEDRAAQIAARMELLQKSIDVSKANIKKIDQDLLKIEQLQNETKGKISFLNLWFKKLKMGLHSIISVSYAKEKRTMQLTTNQKPLGCIFQGPQKGKCSSFQTLWENPGPSQKILGNRLDRSIQASINLGDLMQTKTYLDEKGFQYIDELIKENASVMQTKNQLVARLDDLYKKEGFAHVTHAKKTQSVLSRWQKVTHEVLSKLGQSVHFDTLYNDPLERDAGVRTIPDNQSFENKPIVSSNEEKSPRQSVIKTYEDMKDASADDINTTRDISIFETISKKYLQKLNEF